ncbi:MAG: lipid A biosynthesis acyltransferase [Burkholderiales bacterium]|nr:lipid A biosynthesis acyltransferase [Burkholderiales bacterium]
MSRLALALLRAAHRLPLPLLRAIGAALGMLLFAAAGERRRVAQANLAACLPALDRAARARLVAAAFRHFAQGLVDRAVLWHAAPERVRALVAVEGEEHLDRAAGRPVILLAPHFVGLDAAWTRLTMDRRMATTYARQKDRAFDAALAAGRARFNAPVLLSRQDGARAALRALRAGLPYYLLPDMDLGARDAVFAPFFGVPAATVTTVSRLARLTGAAVLPCVATLTPSGYRVVIHPAWTGFPGAGVEEDTRRMNAFIEDRVREAPAQYHWLHKRFKTRPPGAAPIYGAP